MELNWRKSRYSVEGGGNCVEIAPVSDGTAVRDSKNPTGPRLDFPTTTWQRFLADLPG